ncbi:hypothetical protein J5N97_013545 [Dioscorea zingiberensis]|uniref:Uncharacterized protein n=1 Tax=Dioscorea zingiberensis TaxID=325984 RepID=A0A9D5CQZ0_9LILI|nr:hypothetical protein J5N97_013545 [Dioscorea zingiberensis]
MNLNYDLASLTPGDLVDSCIGDTGEVDERNQRDRDNRPIRLLKTRKIQLVSTNEIEIVWKCEWTSQFSYKRTLGAQALSRSSLGFGKLERIQRTTAIAAGAGTSTGTTENTNLPPRWQGGMRS